MNGSMAKETADTKIKRLLISLDEMERCILMQKQIQAFKEKVELCEETYSTDLTAKMLKLSADRKTPGQESSIDSVWKLRKLIQTSAKSKHDDNTMVFAKWLLNNILYLRELKTNYDERIYKPMLHFFSPGKNQLGTPPYDSSIHPQDPKLDRSNSILIFKDDLPEVKELYDNSEVENIISRLQYLHDRWEHLLQDEGEINPALFSVNSEDCIGAYNIDKSYPPKMRNFLRLTPDILLKCKNAAQLSKQWLDTVSRKMLDTNTRLHKLEHVHGILNGKLSTLLQDIENCQTQLQSETGELENLLEHEERSNVISSATYDLDIELEEVRAKVDRAEAEVKRLEEAARLAVDSKSRSQLIDNIYENQIVIDRLHSHITLLLYQKGILTEDLAVELAVKPSIIRFTNSVQDKCEQLEHMLDEKKSEKQRLESALVPVREDTMRVQAELSRAELSRAEVSRESAKRIGTTRTSEKSNYRGTEFKLLS